MYLTPEQRIDFRHELAREYSDTLKDFETIDPASFVGLLPPPLALVVAIQGGMSWLTVEEIRTEWALLECQDLAIKYRTSTHNISIASIKAMGLTLPPLPADYLASWPEE